MARPTIAVEPLLDDPWLDLDALCRVAGVRAEWIRERSAAGLLPPAEPSGRWRLDAVLLQRLHCMARIERDFDAVPELAALVADLEAELDRLRRRLGEF